MENPMNREAITSISRAIPALVGMPARRYSVDYDEEADVLYISFERPQEATDTEATDDGLLMRYRGEELVGITVLNASTRTEEARGAA